MSAPSLFHPAVAAWFERSFRGPTAAQAQAWPAIKARRMCYCRPDRSARQRLHGGDDDLVRPGTPSSPGRNQIVSIAAMKAP